MWARPDRGAGSQPPMASRAIDTSGDVGRPDVIVCEILVSADASRVGSEALRVGPEATRFYKMCESTNRQSIIKSSL